MNFHEIGNGNHKAVFIRMLYSDTHIVTHMLSFFVLLAIELNHLAFVKGYVKPVESKDP